jgi:hypothetical protein
MTDLFPFDEPMETLEPLPPRLPGSQYSGGADPPNPSTPVVKVGPLRPVVKEGDSYNPEKRRDMIRSYIAYSFTLIFALTILAALYVVIWRNSSWPQTKELIELLLPAETALIGSAVGFYFGSKAAASDSS